MTIAEALRRDVQQLYERVTGTPYPRERFQQAASPLPPQADPVPYLRQRLDQLREIVDARMNQGASSDTRWVPVAEVLEGAEDYEIRLELPGLSKADLEVQAGDNVIRVRGERKLRPPPEKRVLSCERIYGPFERWISLPFLIDGKDLEIQFEDGVLRIHVMKREGSRNSLEAIEIN